MLGDRTHQGRHGSLLKSVGADGGSANLATDDDNRHRIGHAVAHRSDGIGRSRTRSHQTHPDSAARTGIAGRHEASPLFIRRHDQWQLLTALALLLLIEGEDCIVGGQDRPAAVAKDCSHPLVGQHLNDGLSAGHGLTGQGMDRNGRA